MRYSFLLLLIMMMVSCSDTETKVSEDVKDSPHANTKPTGTIASPNDISTIPGCYQMISGKDSAFLTIKVQDSTVTGNLEYRWFEKDQNRGTITGMLRDELIVADYQFQSEGMTSTREVIFKIDGNELREATGAITEREGKMIFTDRQQLDYTKLPPFKKTNCID